MLDVVIVSYRRADLLRACLDALNASPPTGGMSIHVVDNAASPAVAEVVAAHPSVTLTALPANAGFGRAANLGIRAGSAEYVVVLNPDVFVSPGALDRLRELLNERPRAAAAGPLLVRADGSTDHAARRSFPTPLSALGQFSGIARRKQGPASLVAYRAPLAAAGGWVDAINGAFMMLRRAALDEVGLFDEEYWMYMEDLDLLRRLADAGWRTWYEPSVRVVHLKGAIAGTPRPLRLDFHFHRGMGRYYRRHEAPHRPAALNGAVYTGVAAKFVLSATAFRAARVAARRRPSARGVRQLILRMPAPVRRVLTPVALTVYERAAAARAGDEAPSVAGQATVPPALLRVAATGSAGAESYLQTGRSHADVVAGLIHRHLDRPHDAGPALDFGCGSGRLLRWWAKDEICLWHGCDIDTAAVKWCRANLRDVTVVATELMPPLPYHEDTFGLLVAFSVLTHLPAELGEAWMTEFRRVLRPGGMLVLTTHGDQFLDRLTPQEALAYRSEKIVCQLSEVAGSNACATFHPPRRVAGDLLAGLELLESRPGDPPLRLGGLTQDCWVARLP